MEANPSPNPVAIQRALDLIDPRLQRAVKHLADTIPGVYLVGGFVRDALLGMHPKDIDLEIFGILPHDLERCLNDLFPGQVNPVGRSFGIIKIDLAAGLEFDVSIPRRESKTGKGHTGFTIESDPWMSLEEAARRRDFTINAISYDLTKGVLVDPFHGITDLEHRILRVTDPKRFQDDPLRVYRALQLSARLHVTVDPQTLDLLQEMVARGDLNELAPERITEELKKLLLKAEHPSLGFKLAKQLGIIQTHFPELGELIDTPQEVEWHPEGDVWIHTLMVIDEAAKLIRQINRGFSESEKLQVMLGALCHDLGKPATTTVIDGRIRSRGHEEAGEEVTRHFCRRLAFGEDTIRAAIAAAKEHLKPALLARDHQNGTLSDAQYINAVRKLLKRIAPVSWRILIAVSEADSRGRGVSGAADASYTVGQRFVAAVKELRLDVEPIRPLLEGRDLLDLGMSPGPVMGQLIEHIEALRDDGKITTKEEALIEAKRCILHL